MERDELLIEAVRGYPCLFNNKIPDFKVHLKKENAWTAISELLERTIEDCQKRWKTLREKFVKEIKKDQKRSGDGAKVCVPWELLHHMEFIKEYVKHRKSEGNMVSSAADEEESQQGSEEVQHQCDDQAEQHDISSPSTPVSIVSSISKPTRKRFRKSSLTPDRDKIERDFKGTR